MTTGNMLGELGRISCVVGGRWLRWSARWHCKRWMTNSATLRLGMSARARLKLQKDMRGFSDVQAKMGHEIASFITGLQEASVTEGLTELGARTYAGAVLELCARYAWCWGNAARDHWGGASSDDK